MASLTEYQRAVLTTFTEASDQIRVAIAVGDWARAGKISRSLAKWFGALGTADERHVKVEQAIAPTEDEKCGHRLVYPSGSPGTCTRPKGHTDDHQFAYTCNRCGQSTTEPYLFDTERLCRACLEIVEPPEGSG